MAVKLHSKHVTLLLHIIVWSILLFVLPHLFIDTRNLQPGFFPPSFCSIMFGFFACSATHNTNYCIETGMLKFYTNYGYNRTGMRNADIDSSDLLSSFETKGKNLYANLSYRESLKKNRR